MGLPLGRKQLCFFFLRNSFIFSPSFHGLASGLWEFLLIFLINILFIYFLEEAGSNF